MAAESVFRGRLASLSTIDSHDEADLGHVGGGEMSDADVSDVFAPSTAQDIQRTGAPPRDDDDESSAPVSPRHQPLRRQLCVELSDVTSSADDTGPARPSAHLPTDDDESPAHQV